MPDGFDPRLRAAQPFLLHAWNVTSGPRSTPPLVVIVGGSVPAAFFLALVAISASAGGGFDRLIVVAAVLHVWRVRWHDAMDRSDLDFELRALPSFRGIAVPVSSRRTRDGASPA